MKKKLLIFSTAQFGYLTDTLKYCEYAKDDFDITYLGWDYGKIPVNMPGINIIHVSREGNLYTRNQRLLSLFNKHVRMNYDAIFANYTRGISIIQMLNRKSIIILDIRTLRDYRSKINRLVFDLTLKFESLFFKKISVISDGVAKKIWLKKYYLLPLGADMIAEPTVKSENLHLLYVGTLFNRDIIKCVRAFHSYKQKSDDQSALFTIIGDYPEKEFQEIKQYISDNSLASSIICAGTIPHNQLKKYFLLANLGVSFIPMTPYFNYQPATKTFEYLLAGLSIIATKTHENIIVLCDKPQAILINDDETEFANAIEQFRKKGVSVDADSLAGIQKYSWYYIVKNSFIPMFEDKVS